MLPSASIINIDPNSIKNQTFSTTDETIIPYTQISSSFNPNNDNIEYFIYDLNNNILFEDYDFSDFKLNENTISDSSGSLEYITLDPVNDCINNGFDVGELKSTYNFISYQLGSNNNDRYYISDISSDRTELRLKSNYIPYGIMSSSFSSFNDNILLNPNYFDEFYINFGNNNYFIGINALLETSSILIKLYEPLPDSYDIDDTLYIVTKPAESVAYKIKFDPIFYNNNILYIKGPNYNLNIKNSEGISTEYKNKNSITDSSLSSSQFQINNLLSDKGVEINADYTDFSTFSHFSSVSKRLENFYIKLSNIEEYQSNLNDILNIVGSTSSSIAVSSSILKIKEEINNIISNFDGYEYYLYYESGSWAWPKINSEYPYDLEPISSPQAISWYNNIQESASIYDNSNQNNLIYTIPEFIREDLDNANYESFIYMMGQFFDILWLQTKGITDKLNADNRLLQGVSKDLVADVIKSLGVETYTNNYALQNIYTSFIGADSTGNYLPPTGSEWITNYIAVNSGSYPYSIDDVNKEIYKRLYHNISYILKKKGTTQAIKELANIYGIPSTILRINEFGGRDQLQDTGDYSQNIFNYAYVSNGVTSSFSNIRIPFSVSPTNNNRNTSPSTVLLRFKTPTFFSNQDYNTRPSQSLFYLGRSPGGTETSVKPFALSIEYSGSLTSGSYSGSIIDPYYQYGNVKLIMSGSTGNIYSASIYLPVFNGDWWSVMVRKDTDNIRLFVKNKIYNGYDGNILGFQASASLNTSDTSSWVTTPSTNILRVGTGGYSYAGKSYLTFSGSLQEVRYYNTPLNEYAFDSYVLNPLSIEGNEVSGSSSYNTLRFRASLGADLLYGNDSQSLYLNSSNFDGGCFDLKSTHPSITGSSPTSSYPNASNGNQLPISASRYLLPETSSLNILWSMQPNVETIFIKEPVAGIRNRVTNKIEIENNIIPGNTLSKLISLEQNYPFSSSYTKDINYLEVVFSPQNELNDDISDQLGGFNVGEYISPNEIYGSSSLTYYPSLQKTSEDYFKKYTHPYDIWDYVRLIKYFDNSLFKLIKDFTPARTSLSSGILFKQHLLERNRYPLPTPILDTFITNVASGSINRPFTLGNIYLTASIGSIPSLSEGQKTYIASSDYTSNPIETVEGGNGGMFNSNTTQSWVGYNNTPVGLIPFSQSSQDEFFNGEFSGSILNITDQRLVSEECELILYAPTTVISYRPTLFRSSNVTYDFFLSANTVPSASELYLFYDTGSTDIAPYTPPFIGLNG